jgi:hypothetical protein
VFPPSGYLEEEKEEKVEAKY